MNLAQAMLQWPQQVAQQVHAALFLPASDLHPQHARELVPKALWNLSAARLSPAVAQAQAWQEFDGRQLPHRLALLPRAVLTRVAWNLGLLIFAPRLRQVVLRSELEQLASQGLDSAAWQLVFSNQAGGPSEDLGPLEQWGPAISARGERVLLGLADEIGGALGQRLKLKLDPNLAPSPPVPAELLSRAYAPAVQAWLAPWDNCLAQT